MGVAMNKLQTFLATLPGGFIVHPEQVTALLNLDRLFPLLVRCGCCRFTCAVQDLDHLKRCIDAGGDYVRDVSVPVGGSERAASWVEFCPVTPFASLPASFIAPRSAARRSLPGRAFNESDCGGVFDGFGVVSDADSGL